MFGKVEKYPALTLICIALGFLIYGLCHFVAEDYGFHDILHIRRCF